MMSAEKLLRQERLEKILPDWNIDDDLEATTGIKNIHITEEQINQIAILGLFAGPIYLSPEGLSISFSGRIS